MLRKERVVVGVMSTVLRQNKGRTEECQLGTSGFAEFSKFGKRVTGFTEFTESDQGISIDFTPKSSIKKKIKEYIF